MYGLATINDKIVIQRWTTTDKHKWYSDIIDRSDSSGESIVRICAFPFPMCFLITNMTHRIFPASAALKQIYAVLPATILFAEIQQHIDILSARRLCVPFCAVSSRMLFLSISIVWCTDFSAIHSGLLQSQPQQQQQKRFM